LASVAVGSRALLARSAKSAASPFDFGNLTTFLANLLRAGFQARHLAILFSTVTHVTLSE
jgi:hypothetical protein